MLVFKPAVVLGAGKDVLLTGHASNLTSIEAPHYRTLNSRKDNLKNEQLLTLKNLFDSGNRIINLDTIPDDHKTAKDINLALEVANIFLLTPRRAGQIINDVTNGI